MRLEELWAGLLGRGREAIPWEQMAGVSVIARLCEPSSELHIAEDWYRTTALEDLLGIAAERIELRTVVGMAVEILETRWNLQNSLAQARRKGAASDVAQQPVDRIRAATGRLV